MGSSQFDSRFDDEIIDSTELVARFIDNMKQASIEAGNQILSAWRAIIESIRPNAKTTKNAENFGRNLASHSKIVDFKNGILLVEADHSSWLQMLQLHQRYILGSLQRRFPDMHIATLAFRLKGSNVGLSIGYEESLRRERAKMNQRFNAEEKYLEEQGFGAKLDNVSSTDLPPQLRQIFDNLREKMTQDMLTNEEKI